MWTHPLILAGLVTLALPVVIHLALRSRPKERTFPALRFVTESHHATVKLTRLKHFALLALRLAALALVVLILARPIDRPQPNSATRENSPAAKPENLHVALAPLRVSSARPAVGSPKQVAVVRTAELSAGASDAAGLVALALSPDSRATTGLVPTLVLARDLNADRLKGVDAVFLADAAGVSSEGWAEIERFVSDGGGLVVLLGHNVETEIKSGHSSERSGAATPGRRNRGGTRNLRRRASGGAEL